MGCDVLGGNKMVEGVGIGCDGIDGFLGVVFWFVDNLRDDFGGFGREITDGCDGFRGVTTGWEGFGGTIGWEGFGWEETGWEGMTGGCVEVGTTGWIGFGGTIGWEGLGRVVTCWEGMTGVFVEVGTTGCIGFGGDKTEIEDFTGSTTGRGGGVAIDDESDTARSSGFVITGFIGCECIEFTTGGSTGTGGIDWLTITTLLIGVSDISIGFDWVETTLFPSVLFCLFNTFFFDCGFVIGSWCFFLFNK